MAIFWGLTGWKKFRQWIGGVLPKMYMPAEKIANLMTEALTQSVNLKMEALFTLIAEKHPELARELEKVTMKPIEMFNASLTKPRGIHHP